MEINNMNHDRVHCPMCGGTPPAHFEDCKSIERKGQALREADAAAEALENEPEEFPVLFIGGPLDGERKSVKELPPFYNAPYHNPDHDMPCRKEDPYNPREPAFLYAPYRREAFKTSTGIYPVYVLDKIPQEDVMHTLLDGYKTAA